MIFHKKRKAITFSFDDGVVDDIRLVALFNKYNLKGTFNLNAGMLTSSSCWRYADVKDVYRLNYFDCPDLYTGHEVACHAYSHPFLEKLDRKTLENEVKLDKKILEYLYSCQVRGMAYPFGTFNDGVIEVLRENGIEYCRTIVATHGFAIPKNPLQWETTCPCQDEALFDLAERFLGDEGEEDLLFYVWGHSYEFVTEDDWDRFERFCRMIANRDDVFYGTNIEILDCVKKQG